MKKKTRSRCLVLAVLIAAVMGLSGCGTERTNASFSQVDKICELATLQCYYHNVAVYTDDDQGVFRRLTYKKLWLEYDGIVDWGIEAAKVKISRPNVFGTVKVTMPEARILDVDVDEDSMKDPVTEHGLLGFMSLNGKEEREAYRDAQHAMKKQAAKDKVLKKQAETRARELLENYVINAGKAIGRKYTVQWVKAKS